MKALLVRAFALSVIMTPTVQSKGQKGSFHIYAGNTHSHSIYTNSHGSHLNHTPGFKSYMFVDSSGVSHSTNSTFKDDWQKYQGYPEAHYALAKANGFDFYAVTDHSQEADFHPTRADNKAWLNIKAAADKMTDNNFVALRGFEYSENNGPNGNGHINVYNTLTYLNALEPGNELQSFYKWLESAPPYEQGAVVACFNHPGAKQYNDWDYRDAKVTDIITLLEIINSNKATHYEAFVNALDKGWKVSPVSGIDNHGFDPIKNSFSRTFVLAKEKTKEAILDAMKNRRTYASLDQNIQCSYTVNGKMMGSTLNREQVFRFNISVSDPDTNNPDDKITKIDIVKDGGKVVQTYDVPNPSFAVEWNPTIREESNKYFFVRIWNAGGGHTPKADPQKPIAWLAPVWINR